MSAERQYLAIDLKSFFASVECVERGLDPLRTHLVVADLGRTEKTICLAVTPSLKAYGISGRARLFEVVERVREVNLERLCFSPEGIFTGKSSDAQSLADHPGWALDYIVAPPRMKLYVDYSARVYNVYLRYVAPEDIHVYSIDEVIMDVTEYLSSYRLTAHELAMKMIREVLAETGITATAGIGTNMYLSKVAMDIVAKHIPADKDGVRVAELDEMSYRRQLWSHRPLTDFWRVGRGTARKLQANGMNTMGDVARCSVMNEELLYKLFGIMAEPLIDHAWGWEPCTMAAVKAYRPQSNSFSSSQVLHEPYTATKARVVVREMADAVALKLLDKGLVTDQLVLAVGYDITSLGDSYQGEVVSDWYGREAPKPAHGSVNLGRQTSSAKVITEAVVTLFDRIVDPALLIRRMTIATNHVLPESKSTGMGDVQLDIFTDYETLARQQAEEQAALDKERRMQQAALSIKKRFGKNAILRGASFEEGATARDRNRQIGGHKA